AARSAAPPARARLARRACPRGRTAPVRARRLARLRTLAARATFVRPRSSLVLAKSHHPVHLFAMPRLPFEKHLLGSGLLFRALIAGLVAAWVCAATPALIAQAGARPDANAPPAARADGALEGDEAAANGVLGRALETGGGPQGAFPP